jgi:tryptophan synthase alpha subunit
MANTSDPPRSAGSTLRRWWAVIFAIGGVIATVAVFYGVTSTKGATQDAAINELKAEVREHQKQPAHRGSAITDAVTEQRLMTVERAVIEFTKIKERLTTIENKQDALCADSPRCARQYPQR